MYSGKIAVPPGGGGIVINIFYKPFLLFHFGQINSQKKSILVFYLQEINFLFSLEFLSYAGL
jgi:hypothetical protein